jgi:hypothetical protein
MLIQYPAFLRRPIEIWSEVSTAVKCCPPPTENLDFLGITPEDIRVEVRQLVRESLSLRAYVLSTTKVALCYFDGIRDRDSYRSCRDEANQALAACEEKLSEELAHLVVYKFPRLCQEVCTESLNLASIRTPIVVPEFPTETPHWEISEGENESPALTLLSSTGAGPGCAHVCLVDESWQLRSDYLAGRRRVREMLKGAQRAGLEPPDDLIHTEPVRRDMRLTDLTLKVLVRGAPEYRRREASQILEGIQGAFLALDAAMLVDSAERTRVFDSILASSPYATDSHSGSHSSSHAKRKPLFMRERSVDVTALVNGLLKNSHLWRSYRAAAMESAWMDSLYSASSAIDESVLKAMVELCVDRPRLTVSRNRGVVNPIAKAFREIGRAVQLRRSNPSEALLAAVTAMESILLYELPYGVYKGQAIERRVSRLLGGCSEAVPKRFGKWSKGIYQIRSKVVHGNFVDDDSISMATSAAIFLSGNCIAKICAVLGFNRRIGLTPEAHATTDALKDVLDSLESGEWANTHTDHFDLGRWPSRLFDVAAMSDPPPDS